MSSELEGPVSDDEEYDPYSMMPVTKLVALYDYSYQDDDGNLVHMKEGERYHLIQKEGDWWEVVRDMGNLDDLSFYVPANYVRVVDNNSGSGVNSSTTATRTDESCVRDDEENGPGNRKLFEDSSNLSSAQVTPEKNVDKTENGVQGLVDTMAEDSVNELRFERKPSTTFSTFGNTSGSLTQNSKGADTKGLRRSFSDEGDYVNLDQYRIDIGFSPDRDHDDGQEEMYANLQQLHGQDGGGVPPPPDTPPPASEGVYLKTLLGVWDKYLDPNQKREFYVNKETQERTYKPPRPADKQKQVVTLLSSPYSHVQEHYVQRPPNTVEALNSRKVSLPDIQVQAPTGWRIEDSAAGKIFVSCATNEKWASKVNEDGQRYYFRIDGDESAWELPKVDESELKASPPLEPPPTRSPSRSPRMGRSVKAKSMVIGKQINFQSYVPTIPSQIPKSQTLPANMSTPIITL